VNKSGISKSMKAVEGLNLLGFGKSRRKRDAYVQFENKDDKTIYYRLGIIDFLQKYGKRKKLEYKSLKIIHPNVPATDFSC
jgi:hypothetical protein